MIYLKFKVYSDIIDWKNISKEKIRKQATMFTFVTRKKHAKYFYVFYPASKYTSLPLESTLEY